MMSWFTKNPIYRFLDDKIDLPSWLSWNNGDVNEDSVIKNPESGLTDKTDPNNPGNNGSLTQNNTVNEIKKDPEVYGALMAGTVVNPYVSWLNTGINALGLGVGLYNDYRNRQMAEKALEYQKRYDAQALGFGEKQFVEGIRQYEKDYDAQMQAMAQQQYNYENAYQIQANDMSKAGLNPLNAGGANGQSVSFSPSGNVSGSVGSSSVGNNQVNSTFASLLSSVIQSKTAIEVAKINSKTAKDTASISAEASKYGSDVSYKSSSERIEAESVIALQQKEIRQAELDERKYEYDTDVEKAFRLKTMELDHNRTIELIRQKSENARAISSLDVESFKAASNAFNGALHTSAYFAIGMANLRQAYEALEYAKSRDEKDRAQRNFEAMLDSQTQVFSSITGLAGDVCRGFIIGNVAGRR